MGNVPAHASRALSVRLPIGLRNIISSRMAHHDHAHAMSHAVPETPGWSLLRLSASARIGLAAGIVALLWVATFAVIA